MRHGIGRQNGPARARALGRRVTAGLTAVLLAMPLACGGESTAPSAPRDPALDVTAVIPAVGRISGGSIVVVMGLGFREGATVTVDGVAATAVQVVNGISITAVAPAGRALGPVAVAVTNPDGRRVELPLHFRYVADDDDRLWTPWDY